MMIDATISSVVLLNNNNNKMPIRETTGSPMPMFLAPDEDKGDMVDKYNIG